VTILVRKAAAVDKHDHLTVVEGSVLSDTDVNRAFTAAGAQVDAVLGTLNSSRASENPWAKFIGPARLIADSTAIATGALRRQQRQPKAHKPRLVVLSAIGVGESRKSQPFILRTVVDYSNIAKTYEDHNATNDEVEGNCGGDVDFTVVMAVALGDAGLKQVRTFGPAQKASSMFITRESLARWMVDVAAGKLAEEFSNKRVIVSN